MQTRKEVTVEEIIQFLKPHLNSIKGKEKQELTPTTDIMTDFGSPDDDLFIMEIAMELECAVENKFENKFNVKINDEQIAFISISSSRRERSPATPEAFTDLINESLTEV